MSWYFSNLIICFLLIQFSCDEDWKYLIIALAFVCLEIYKWKRMKLRANKQRWKQNMFEQMHIVEFIFENLSGISNNMNKMIWFVALCSVVFG